MALSFSSITLSWIVTLVLRQLFFLFCLYASRIRYESFLYTRWKRTRFVKHSCDSDAKFLGRRIHPAERHLCSVTKKKNKKVFLGRCRVRLREVLPRILIIGELVKELRSFFMKDSQLNVLYQEFTGNNLFTLQVMPYFPTCTVFM